MSHNSNNNDASSWATAAIRHQIPYTTRLRHGLSCYNPTVWWRAAVMRKRFVSWNTYEVILLFLCGGLSPWWPPLLMTSTRTITTTTPKSFQTDRWSWLTVAAVTPMYGYVCYKSTRMAYGMLTSIREIRRSRMMAHPEAYQCLYERLQPEDPTNDQTNDPTNHHTTRMEPPPQPRAYRTFAYDVYLPPPPPSSNNNNDDDTLQHSVLEFILFLPGAFVEHVAYASPAALLSDHGYIVVVLSSEPTTGIVETLLPPFDARSIQRIQRDVEAKYASTHHHQNHNQPCRWIFMGHSMGSLTCTKLVSYFPHVQDIVLWGSAPFLDYMGDVSNMTTTHHGPLQVLVVQGTRDDIIQRYCTLEMIEEYWRRLPPATTTIHEIVGGTHHGFGNYIRQYVNELDKSDTMPIQEQHAVAVQVTVDFLRKRSL